LAEYCNLPGEEYWNAAEFMFALWFGDPTQPDHVYRKCDLCDHVGWAWLMGRASDGFEPYTLCVSCRAIRLRAAETLARLNRLESEEATSEVEESTSPDAS
jgi:hypothetical protein